MKIMNQAIEPSLEVFLPSYQEDPYLTLEECEIELIKEQALSHLKVAMKAFYCQSLSKKYSWFVCTFHQLMRFEVYLMSSAEFFYKTSEQIFNKYFQAYLVQVEELKKRGSSLPGFRSVDLLLEGCATKTLFKSFTNKQKEFLTHLFDEENLILLTSGLHTMRFSLYILSVLVLLYNSKASDKSSKNVIFRISIAIIVNLFRLGIVNYKALKLEAESIK